LFSPDGRQVLTGNRDAVTLWDTRGKELQTLKGRFAAAGGIAFHPDGQRVLTSGPRDTIHVCEAATGKQLAAWKVAPGDLIAVSANGGRILVGNPLIGATLGEVVKGSEYKSLKSFPNWKPLASATFWGDGQRILVGTWFDSAVWDVETGRRLRSFAGIG